MSLEALGEGLGHHQLGRVRLRHESTGAAAREGAGATPKAPFPAWLFGIAHGLRGATLRHGQGAKAAGGEGRPMERGGPGGHPEMR